MNEKPHIITERVDDIPVLLAQMERIAMSSGIPDALLHFVRSIDIVSEDTTDFIRALFDKYMKVIGAGYYLVLIDGAQLPEGPGLGTFQSEVGTPLQIRDLLPL